MKNCRTSILFVVLLLGYIIFFVQNSRYRTPNASSGIISMIISETDLSAIIIEEWKTDHSSDSKNGFASSNYADFYLEPIINNNKDLSPIIIGYGLLGIIGGVFFMSSAFLIKDRTLRFDPIVQRILAFKFPLHGIFLIFSILLIILSLTEALINLTFLNDIEDFSLKEKSMVSVFKSVTLYFLLISQGLIWLSHKIVSSVIRSISIIVPSLVILMILYVALGSVTQGQDLIVMGLEDGWVCFFLLVSTFIFALITWYSSRLICEVNKYRIGLNKEFLNFAPRVLGWLPFFLIGLAILFNPMNDFMFTKEMNVSIIGYSIGIIYVILNIPLILILFYQNRTDNRFYSSLKKIISFNQPKRDYGFLFFLVLLISCLSNIVVSIFLTENYYVQRDDESFLILPILFTLLGYLFGVLVVARRQMIKSTHKSTLSFQSEINKKIARGSSAFFNLEVSSSTEMVFLKVFNVGSLLILALYSLSLKDVSFGIWLSPVINLIICLTLIIGFFNLVTFLMHKTQVHWFALLFLSILYFNDWGEPYKVPMDFEKGVTNSYNNRPDVQEYLNHKLNSLTEDSTKEKIPLFFFMSDGGGSRSAYWVVLNGLNILEQTSIKKNLISISGASGGTVGNVSVYNRLIDDSPKVEPLKAVSNDYLSAPIIRLLGLDVLTHLFPFIPSDRGQALERSFSKQNPYMFYNEQFSLIQFNTGDSLKMASLPLLFINVTRVQDGRPGMISNININDTLNTFNGRIDVLDLLTYTDIGQFEMKIGTAMIMSSRFPYMSPGINIRNHFFVDGGYFDNSGAGATIETIKAIESRYKGREDENPFTYNVIHFMNSPEVPNNHISPVKPLINDLAAPILTIAGSYGQQTNINKNRLLQYLDTSNTDNSYYKLGLYKDIKNEPEQDYSFSWAMSNTLQSRMQKRAKALQPHLTNHLKSVMNNSN